MPGKHVHFSAAPYATSSTPSPSYSTSTLEDPQQTTPPNLGFGSPYHTVPLPGVATSLHPILATHTTPIIAYDLSLTPETMKSLTYPLPADIWDQPACKPAAPFLEISCPSLPWRITAVPRSKTIGYVTVGDVFAALYRALRTNVTAQEFALVPTSGHKNLINTAYHVRCKRQPTAALYQAEKSKGMKRVDFLCASTRFMGLAPVKGGMGGWVLLVA